MLNLAGGGAWPLILADEIHRARPPIRRRHYSTWLDQRPATMFFIGSGVHARSEVGVLPETEQRLAGSN
jgi:hypothetical protein